MRDLAGYTLGRSDLVRRAMSKKKASVMEKERQNFVYGNQEENVPGCIANGIDEKTANKIYDEMIDFAKYAFNKSHAAAYAVVSYQTAFLKFYYPVEFMAALMTSVIDNPSKVSAYIFSCRNMGIQILPPDVNEGESGFSVSGKDIRFGLSAIKSVGRPVTEVIVEERTENGPYGNLEDFITRLSNKESNKRVLESLIKSGALDVFEGTRKQFMAVYPQIVDKMNREKKVSMTGQMSLFDFAAEEDKKNFEIKLPDIGEYTKEDLLAFEKEVLGVYVSGHPLEEYEEIWKRNVTNVTSDFALDEETGETIIKDGAKAVIGGMITSKTVKHTKNDKMMAFITIEDLLGTVEVVIFPRDYEKNSKYLHEDSKVFVAGRASVEEERAGKLICEKLIPFEEAPKEVWIKFSDLEEYSKNEAKLFSILDEKKGASHVVIYVENPKAIKKLPAQWNIKAEKSVLQYLSEAFGEKNVKVVEKSIENIVKMN